MFTPLLQAYSEPGPGRIIFQLVMIVLMIVAWWKVFEKAGQPGWAAIVPIYNNYILLKVAGRPGWWLLLFLVPLVNIVIYFIMSIDIAKAFGKGTGFGVGLALLPPVFYSILGFGDATYTPPEGAAAEAA